MDPPSIEKEQNGFFKSVARMENNQTPFEINEADVKNKNPTKWKKVRRSGLVGLYVSRPLSVSRTFVHLIP